MASANQLPSFVDTMKWEGRAALSMDRRDGGNWTGGRVGVGSLVGSKFGVSAPVAAKRFPGVKMADITAAQALTVFVDGYWTPCHGDALAIGVDHAVTDCAYNAGPGVALRVLNATIAAKPGDAIAIIHEFSRRRLGFLEGLRTWQIYGKGWARRVAGVEAECVTMAHAAGASLARGAVTLGDHLNAASLAAHDNLVSARKVATASVAAGVAVPLATHSLVAVAAIGTASVVASIISFWKTHVETCRRDALGHAADIANDIA